MEPIVIAGLVILLLLIYCTLTVRKIYTRRTGQINFAQLTATFIEYLKSFIPVYK